MVLELNQLDLWSGHQRTSLLKLSRLVKAKLMSLWKTLMDSWSPWVDMIKYFSCYTFSTLPLFLSLSYFPFTESLMLSCPHFSLCSILSLVSPTWLITSNCPVLSYSHHKYLCLHCVFVIVHSQNIYGLKYKFPIPLLHATQHSYWNKKSTFLPALHIVLWKDECCWWIHETVCWLKHADVYDYSHGI